MPDIAGYDSVYKRLVGAVDLDDVSASFVMEAIKSTTALPLTYAPGIRDDRHTTRCARDDTGVDAPAPSSVDPLECDGSQGDRDVGEGE